MIILSDRRRSSGIQKLLPFYPDMGLKFNLCFARGRRHVMVEQAFVRSWIQANYPSSYYTLPPFNRLMCHHALFSTILYAFQPLETFRNRPCPVHPNIVMIALPVVHRQDYQPLGLRKLVTKQSAKQKYGPNSR